jgi:hypothetical protein
MPWVTDMTGFLFKPAWLDQMSPAVTKMNVMTTKAQQPSSSPSCFLRIAGTHKNKNDRLRHAIHPARGHI